MPTPRQILVSSADQNDWANLYTACLANNIDMSIVFASSAFQNGSVGQQCGCTFDALVTSSKRAASSKSRGKKHIDKEIKKQGTQYPKLKSDSVRKIQKYVDKYFAEGRDRDLLSRKGKQNHKRQKE